MVPKDLAANLEFRRKLIQAGNSDPKIANDLWRLCEAEILFYINAFVWTYDPRKPEALVPFITYDYQDDGILEIQEAIGRHDLLAEKSRDMGASWMFLVTLMHEWQFRRNRSVTGMRCLKP